MEHLEWILCLFLSALVLIVVAVLAVLQCVSRNPRLRSVNTFRMLFAGVALSAFVLFAPFYYYAFAQYDCSAFEAFMIVLYNVIRLFLVNGEYEILAPMLPADPQWLHRGYMVLYSILMILAPVMTFSFVLSFFKNLSACVSYFFRFFGNGYVFSELNERSLALASSLAENKKENRFIVFTEVTAQEENQDLMQRAQELGAICFAKDITAVNFGIHSKKANLHFFTVKEDESDNVTKALKLIERYKYRRNTHLYAFSSGVDGELLLSGAYNADESGREVQIKVRRINRVRSLIYRNLCDTGVKNIFHTALEEDGLKKINALIIGMGKRGTEMLKALTWYGQMTGYRLTINVVDSGAGAEELFTAECPELMDRKLNHHFDIEGEMGCSISFHEGVDIHTKKFRDLLKTLPHTTYAFVALGSDEKNIAASVELRSVFAGMGQTPAIQTAVYNTQMNHALKNVCNFRGQTYDVDFFGDMESNFSEDVILGLDVEKMALARHLLYGQESDFWKFDYNYNSSVASAIHLMAKQQLNLPGIHKAPEDRTQQERQSLRVLEHCRWNAYMRSCGYVYGGTIEKSGRNDLAKRHNFLVAFQDLPPKEQEKDDV